MTTATSTAQEEQQLVVFELASETYGVDIGAVREIIRMQALTKIPQCASYVEGVINLRGAVIPVIDIRKRFGLDWSEEGADTRILVVEVGRKSIGVIVDAVTEVQRITTSAIEPPSSVVLSSDSEYVIGIAKVDDKLIILLDLDKALPIEDIDLIENAGVDAENAPPFDVE